MCNGAVSAKFGNKGMGMINTKNGPHLSCILTSFEFQQENAESAPDFCILNRNFQAIKLNMTGGNPAAFLSSAGQVRS
jgi:hypothetical protein